MLGHQTVNKTYNVRTSDCQQNLQCQDITLSSKPTMSEHYVPFKNTSLIWWHHHCQWTVSNFCPMLGAQGLWTGRDLLSCQTCCDTGPRFFQSHPKDRPIQSPLTTQEGMWRIYSNPYPHGFLKQWKVNTYMDWDMIHLALLHVHKNMGVRRKNILRMYVGKLVNDSSS